MLRDVASRAAALARVAWSRSSSLTGSVASSAAASTGQHVRRESERAREGGRERVFFDACVLVGAPHFVFSSSSVRHFSRRVHGSTPPSATTSRHSTRQRRSIAASGSRKIAK
jgi:hypothetical protein